MTNKFRLALAWLSNVLKESATPRELDIERVLSVMDVVQGGWGFSKPFRFLENLDGPQVANTSATLLGGTSWPLLPNEDLVITNASFRRLAGAGTMTISFLCTPLNIAGPLALPAAPSQAGLHALLGGGSLWFLNQLTAASALNINVLEAMLAGDRLEIGLLGRIVPAGFRPW